MNSNRKVILYIAMSLDGFIARPNGDLDFLSMVEQQGEDYGYGKFMESIDTVIVGRKTYDKIISMGYEAPYSDKEAYIITRSAKPSIGSVKFYTGNLTELVNKLKAGQGKNIYCDGGAEVVDALLREDLIDEFYISVIPILLGSGIALFKGDRTEMKLKLISSTPFGKGLAQLHYARY